MTLPQTIGRFTIVRELGKGAQGSVYLAQDPHLERQVAIKTLRVGKNESTGTLLKEARMVSKLQHPNIVTLYDAGEHEGTPYLVYAYVEGETLAQMLKREGHLPLTRAAQITSGILEGIASAHAQGVLHLDLKPANVMIAANGQPQVMDFGIARSIAQDHLPDQKLNGTPHYMAPEIIGGQPPSPRSDLFSVGMMLYQMATGSTAVDGETIYEVLHRTAHEAAVPPSSKNLHVDERLEAIILKALAKKPQERYADAGAMKQALQDYLDPARNAPAAGRDKHSTLEFLLRRMRSKSDFPALSSTISEINQIVDSESESPAKLTKVILQDFALTNKLLKLVNTVSYGQFGGKVNTISKAVVILGFETVRNAAMTLILLEFLQNKSQAAQLKEEVLSSYFAGLLAMQLSHGRNVRDTEEAMICAMFFNLGKLLAKFYFFEESQEVSLLVEQGMSESQASLKVLGMSYNELGISIVKTWNFPERLQSGMLKIMGSDKVRRPRDELDHLVITVNLANDLCTIAATTPAADMGNALQKLAQRYQDAKISESQLNQALEHGLQEISLRASILNLPTTSSPLLQAVRQWCKQDKREDKGAETHDSMDGITSLDVVYEQSAETGAAKASAEAVLGAGIQDVTNTLVSNFNLNDVFQMVLETMYRGMNFNRVLIFVRDPKTNTMRARFGFGEQIDALLPQFHFPLKFEPDVFHIVLEKGVDIVIEDVTAENISSKIPAWYRRAVESQCFLLLPIMVNNKAIGLFYADMQAANSLQVEPHQLSLLRTLRNQAVLAIKQKQ